MKNDYFFYLIMFLCLILLAVYAYLPVLAVLR